VFPDELKYTAEHEWVRVGDDGGGGDSDVATIGITNYAQEALGDIVYVSLPEVGETLAPGASVGELESTKSVSDVYAPVSGTVSTVNESLDAQPELVNSDPYGEGWLFELEGSDAGALEGLLDASGYQAAVEA